MYSEIIQAYKNTLKKILSVGASEKSTMPHQLTFLSLLQCTGKLKYVQQWQRIEKKVLRSINIPSAEIDKPEHFLWKYELFFRRGRSAPILNRRRRLGQLRHESAFLTIEKTDVPQVGNDFQNTHTEKQIVVSLASPFPRKRELHNGNANMHICISRRPWVKSRWSFFTVWAVWDREGSDDVAF